VKEREGERYRTRRIAGILVSQLGD